MIQIASFSLVLAFYCAAYAGLAAGISLKLRSQAWLARSVLAISAIAGLLVLTIEMLLRL
jgi:hypothetical protein